MISIARKFFRRPAADRRLLAQALVLHVCVAVLLRVVRFGTLTTWLDAVRSSESRDVGAPDAARRIAWAVRQTSRFLPWGRTCLTEALTGALLLRRAGVAATLQFGVARDGERSLVAHAWLDREGTVIVGSPRHYQALQ